MDFKILIATDKVFFDQILDDSMLKDQKTFQNFMPTLYTDKDRKPKAMVLIKMTDEQKKMVEQFSDLSMEEMDKAGMEMIGKPAPPFSVKTLSGDNYSDQSLLGKTVVINFWFIKCKPCVDEIPKLNKLVKKYIHNKDVVFLSISFDQEKDNRSFLEKNPFKYQ
ncbi:MAG: TlpA disulfide reductase family protein, partial [Flavobacteriaceae bacterium]